MYAMAVLTLAMGEDEEPLIETIAFIGTPKGCAAREIENLLAAVARCLGTWICRRNCCAPVSEHLSDGRSRRCLSNCQPGLTQETKDGDTPDVSRTRALRGPTCGADTRRSNASFACAEAERDINLLAGFEARLRARFPAIDLNPPTGGRPISLAHVQEAAALSLQVQAGCTVTFSLTKETVEPGTFRSSSNTRRNPSAGLPSRWLSS